MADEPRRRLATQGRQQAVPAKLLKIVEDTQALYVRHVERNHG
jgi:hypothetical protein